jgi:hypothetical protein
MARRWQLQLSTLIVVALVAAVLVGVNVRTRPESENGTVDDGSAFNIDYTVAGWPAKYEYPIDNYHNISREKFERMFTARTAAGNTARGISISFPPSSFPDDHVPPPFTWERVAINIAAALFILVAVGFGWQHMLKRRARLQPPT